MNRTEARERWARIAAGELQGEQVDEVDLIGWIQRVAVDLLAADQLPAPKRAGAVVKAVGLANKPDPHAQLRAMTQHPRWDFPKISADGVATEARRAEIVRAVVTEARAKGLLRGIYAVDDTKAHDLVRRFLPR